MSPNQKVWINCSQNIGGKNLTTKYLRDIIKLAPYRGTPWKELQASAQFEYSKWLTH